MKINRTIQQNLLLGIAGLAFQLNATAQSLKPTDYVPVINPKSECGIGEVNVPLGMEEYSFISNRDCTAYFVLPPAISEQKIDIQSSGNLRLCSELKQVDQSILAMREDLRAIRAEIAALRLVEPRSEREAERIEKQIANKYEQIHMVNQIVTDEQNMREATYGPLEGATASVVLDSRIPDGDLLLLSKANERVIHNHNQDGNGLPGKYIVRPHFLRAKIQNSLYSFIYRTPETRADGASVISSTIPGLQILEQNGSQTGAAHVKAGDVVTGEVAMNLAAVCEGAKRDPDGSYVIDESNNSPLFTVNRYYEVQQQFEYGYRASLNLEQVVSQMAREIITSKNSGFTKEQIFDGFLGNNIESMLNFDWESNFSTDEHDFDGKMIQDIKNGVFEVFVDNLFEKLVQLNKLEVIEASTIDPAQGAHVDVDRTGTRCWTSRSWFRKKTHCANYTYQVKEWRNAYTETELSSELKLGGQFGETVNVNEMVPLYYTSTFVRPEKGSN